MFFEKGCVWSGNRYGKVGVGVIEVYFDDFKVIHTKSPIVQQESFYPFGLSFDSYSRENSVENRYLYNQGTGDRTFKTERVYELELNIDQSKYRSYDYITGRWWQVDPLADQAGQESWSTYQYAFDNPIRFSDPYGDCVPFCLAIPIIIEGASLIVEAAIVAGVGTAIVATAETYGPQILDAMGNVSPYSTPALD